MATDAGERLLLVSSLVLSLGGLAGFVYLFLLDLTVYWIILSPVILALYELPAVYVYWLYKRRKSRRLGREGPAGPADGTPGTTDGGSAESD
jgi:Ca2+/Na+ antiporter